MDWIQVLGLAAGICTSTSLLPQVIKTLKEKQAHDISLVTLLILMAGLALWVAYGVLREDLPIILTNSFSLMVNVFMIVLRIKYNR